MKHKKTIEMWLIEHPEAVSELLEIAFNELFKGMLNQLTSEKIREMIKQANDGR